MKRRGIFEVLSRSGEYFRVAFRAMLGNGYRSVLTVLMMAVGIAAMVGVSVASHALQASVKEQYAHLGTHTFYLRAQEDGPLIDQRDALALLQGLDFPGLVSVRSAEEGCVISYCDRRTPPNVSLIRTDAGFLGMQALALEQGRNFLPDEGISHPFSALLGSTVARQLFPEEDPLGKWIRVGDCRYRVIGLLAQSQGGTDVDRSVLIPYMPGTEGGLGSSEIGFRPSAQLKQEQVDACVEAVRSCFRHIRHLRPGEADDFVIQRSTFLLEQLDDSMSLIRKGAWIIAALALLGASVGLMNTMLVSVKERVREIGLRMALGATPEDIRAQFLMETLLLGVAGGSIGAVLGVLLGWGVTLTMSGSLSLPWPVLLGALFVSGLVALLSGVLPARRAAMSDPIVSLRTE